MEAFLGFQVYKSSKQSTPFHSKLSNDKTVLNSLLAEIMAEDELSQIVHATL